MVVYTAELTLFLPFIRHHACLMIVDISRIEPRTIFRHSSPANIITSDMQGMIWGEPELTMVYTLLWDVFCHSLMM